MFALAWCLLAAGALCVKSAHAISVRITEADGSRVQANLYPGDVLRVDLPAAPAEGRQWSLIGHSPAQLQMLATTQRVYGGRLSNQGTSSFAWKAISAGEADLMLAYGPQSSRTTHQERAVRLHITIADEALTPQTTAPDVLLDMEQIGTYTRTGPCGDCSGLTERLSLYRAPTQSIFLLRRSYKDAPGGTLTTITSGLWSTSRGTADPTATVYQLVAHDAAYLLRVDGDRLVPLDPQQIPLPAPPGIDNAFHK